tara:strand:- start:232 stop:1266 length:1035 start_codon:yes stop_codon:yes gene_type:complete
MNSYIRKYTITFFCLYGKNFGYGHYSRINSFVKNIKKRVKLVTFGDPINISKKLYSKYDYYKNIKEYNNKNILKKKNSLAILDLSNYSFFKKNNINFFYKKIRNTFEKVIVIDSILNESFYNKINLSVDCLVIPYFVANKYKKKYKKINFLTFPEIYFCNEKILKLKHNKTKQIKNCLVTLGSTDNNNLNFELIKILSSNLFRKINFTFILGKFLTNNYKKKLIALSKEKINIKLIDFNLNFYSLFNKSDLILSSSGITKYEALITKKPNIRIYRNRREKILDNEFSKKQTIKGFNLKAEKIPFINYFKKLVFNENFSKKILNKNFKMLNNIKIKNINNIDVRI